MDLFYILLVLPVATRALGALASRVGQPALVHRFSAVVIMAMVTPVLLERIYAP